MSKLFCIFTRRGKLREARILIFGICDDQGELRGHFYRLLIWTMKLYGRLSILLLPDFPRFNACFHSVAHLWIRKTQTKSCEWPCKNTGAQRRIYYNKLKAGKFKI